MAQREIFDDAVTKYLVNLLTEQEEAMRTLWVDYEKQNANSPTTSPDGNKGKPIRVFPNIQSQLTYNPAIEINFVNKETKIIAIGSQHDQFNYELYLTINQNHGEKADTYLRIMASAVHSLLNDWSRRSFVVPGHSFCFYYSEAGSIGLNYKRGAGMLSCKIPWFCKLFKPDRF